MGKVEVKKETRLVNVVTVTTNEFSNLKSKKVSDTLEIKYPKIKVTDRDVVLETTKTGKFHSFNIGCQIVKEDLLQNILKQLNEEKQKVTKVKSLKTGKFTRTKIKDVTEKYLITAGDKALLRSEYEEVTVEEVVKVLSVYRYDGWRPAHYLKYNGNKVCDNTEAAKEKLKSKIEIMLKIIEVVNENN